ncbi:MAG: redox-sensitive bicupin YhaK (pirin superfamily) [Flavobacteriales bacterium]|jgi:redox-sensitive bicupin YhaK (pirin superfamily)
MFYYRAAAARGNANFDWLNSQHTFSFGNYYDPDHMGISVLRVINDDIVAPGAGFGEHGHRDMEIISYILEGSIEHADSMGNKFVVPAGDVQRMSAGTGVMHSEFNASATEPLKFLQIWISPNVRGIEPSYEQMAVVQSSTMTPLVTPTGRDGSLSIHQDASLFRLQLQAGESYDLAAQKHVGYLQVISGSALSNEYALTPGDGLGIIKDRISISAGGEGLVALWFELPQNNSL